MKKYTLLTWIETILFPGLKVGLVCKTTDEIQLCRQAPRCKTAKP
jgi:hypothetical protein